MCATIGRMELDCMPESFEAGTTQTYRRNFADYPADAGWTLKLHLAGASVRTITAVADGTDFVMTIAAGDTAGAFAAGVYKWGERVSNVAGEVYQIAAGVVTVEPNLAEASEGSEQLSLERQIHLLEVYIERRLATGMDTFQIAGRAVSYSSVKEAKILLASAKAELAHLANPESVTRLGLFSFTGTGFDR